MNIKSKELILILIIITLLLIGGGGVYIVWLLISPVENSSSNVRSVHLTTISGNKPPVPQVAGVSEAPAANNANTYTTMVRSLVLNPVSSSTPLSSSIIRHTPQASPAPTSTSIEVSAGINNLIRAHTPDFAQEPDHNIIIVPEPTTTPIATPTPDPLPSDDRVASSSAAPIATSHPYPSPTQRRYFLWMN